jgi:hypothetical protein
MEGGNARRVLTNAILLTRPPRRAETRHSAGEAAGSQTEQAEVEVKVKERFDSDSTLALTFKRLVEFFSILLRENASHV